MKNLTWSASALLFLGLFCAISARAGDQVTSPTMVFEVSTLDGVPVKNAEVNASLSDNHHGLQWCGDVIPYPGICWKDRTVKRQIVVTDESGQAVIKSVRFDLNPSSDRNPSAYIFFSGVTLSACDHHLGDVTLNTLSLTDPNSKEMFAFDVGGIENLPAHVALQLTVTDAELKALVEQAEQNCSQGQ